MKWEYIQPVTIRFGEGIVTPLYLSIPSSECVGNVSMHEYASHLRVNASFGAKVSTHFITTAVKCASVHKSQTRSLICL